MGKIKVADYAYIFFFAVYPILALRQVNIVYVNLSVTMRSLGLTLVAAAGSWLLLRWLMKDWHKAGILTVLGVMLFYSYGHLYLWMLESNFGPVRHRTLIAFYLIILGAAAFLMLKRKTTSGLVRFLNISGIVLISLVLVQSFAYAFEVKQSSEAVRENRPQAEVSEAAKDLPDIYLIILDAHTRSDVLLEDYDFDNRDFIVSLEEMGFYVAECSQSNYPGTNFSIISMMNMDYFYHLFDEVRVLPALKHSAVSETLRGLGYTVVAFENRSSGHFDLLEDVHLSRNATVLENVDIGGGINEFESMLIETSLLRIFVDMPQLLPKFVAGDVKDAEFYEHYLQTYYILDELKTLPAMPGPKFVMAHIMTPHDPFIFAPDGSYQPSGKQGSMVGYRNNVSFIDHILPETIEEIIRNSETPPVVIVMGDHGPTGDGVSREARMSILNAYYLEEDARKSLYPTITLVNSFRVVFNAYFDTGYPLLEDRSHYVWNNNQMLSQDNQVASLCQSAKE